MNLVIDIGNTYTKIAVFKQDEIICNRQFKEVDGTIVENLLNEHKVNRAIISSVKKKETAGWQQDLSIKVPLTYFTRQMAPGIKNHYLTPDTLGVDRLAAILGAAHLYPEVNCLVISGGTCITYDWVDAEGNYFGGSISPGLNMRYKALNNYTDGLPLIGADEGFDRQYGDSTAGAILSGVQNGIKYELAGFIESYYHADEKLKIVLGGGDSIFFDSLLKNSIFAPYIKIEPYLVLKGLNAALYNNND